MRVERRRQMIEPDHPRLSIARQCALVAISRSGFYHRPAGETPLNLALMRLIDAQFLETPWYGSRQMARHLRREGYVVGRKRVRRLMAKMGLAPIYQRPRTSIPHPEHRVFPYLLRDAVLDRPNQVWCADITDLPMRRGFLYLVAVMDWAARKVLAWRVSNTLDVEFCLEALEEALARFGRPAIVNSERQRATGSSAGASPGQPVHLAALHRRAAGGRGAHLDGRPRPLDGQRVHRAAVAQSEVRVHLPARLRDRLRAAGRLGPVDRLLQCQTPPFRPGRQDPRRGV
jgi:putative transposase